MGAGEVIGYIILAIVIALLLAGCALVVYRSIRHQRLNQKFTLFEDDSASVAVDPYDDEPEVAVQPKRSRLALATQFSAAAAMGTDPNPSSSGQTAFTHSIQSSDHYIWPSKGGSAVPVSVDWGPIGSPSTKYNKTDLAVAQDDKGAGD
uniref:Uncharacterized protein n=1 Tax=Spongospora subterranea TaxID=70186 RepID=A0A0H5R6S9_9EUKA|eukprot:CRZ09818.1 hypothetical protein [Spongospora subterranea]